MENFNIRNNNIPAQNIPNRSMPVKQITSTTLKNSIKDDNDLTLREIVKQFFIKNPHFARWSILIITVLIIILLSLLLIRI